MKKKFLFLSLLLSCPILSSCNSEKISQPIGDAIENALPNLWISLAQLAAFGVTLFVFFKFFYKPLKDKIEQRNKHIKNNIKESERLKKEAEDSANIASKIINVSKNEANKIIEDARISALAEADTIKKDAEESIRKSRLAAEEEIVRAKEEMEKEMQSKIISLSLEASKEILGRELTKKDNDKIVDAFISNIKD